MGKVNQLCTFILHGSLFGIEVEKVQEVFNFQEMTRVPLAPGEVKGLINLRGQILTAIDLRRRLDFPERSPEALPMNVVVQNDDLATSLLVDEIVGVIEVEEDLFESSPETLKGVARELIKGAYKLKDSLLLVLDINKTLQLPELQGGSLI